MSHQYKILIVDDNEHNRYSLQKTLQKPEYQFFEAHDGPSSLQLVQSVKPDLILLDVRLPGVDGFQICESIRQFEKHVPIVFVTANLKEFVDQVHGFEKGGDEYIIQPYDPKELMMKIKVLLRNKKLYDELLNEVQKLDRLKAELNSSNEELKKVNTQLAEKNDFLVSLTITDPLTSLFNRKYFHQRIEKEISAVKRYKHESSAAIIDIDHYGNVNERFSAQQGDVVLKELASLLVNSVRNSDVVTRFDGGKFAIIFTHTPEDNALTKAKMIYESIAAYPFPVYEDLVSENIWNSLSDKMIRLTASISVAALSHAWIKDEADLIQALNTSIEKAKQQGGNRVLTVTQNN